MAQMCSRNEQMGIPRSERRQGYSLNRRHCENDRFDGLKAYRGTAPNWLYLHS